MTEVYSESGLTMDDPVTRGFCDERTQSVLKAINSLDEKLSLLLELSRSELKEHSATITTQGERLSKVEQIAINKKESKDDSYKKNAKLIGVTGVIIGVISNIDKIIKLFGL